MSTTKKFSGKAMGYLILLGLVVLSWAIFKILSPHNFGSFGNMLNYFQASLIATVGAVGFYFVMVMGMFDFSIGANIMLSAIVGCVFATRFNLGYFGLIVGCILTGTIVGALNGMFYVKLRIPSMIVTTGLAPVSYTHLNCSQNLHMSQEAKAVGHNPTKNLYMSCPLLIPAKM